MDIVSGMPMPPPETGGILGCRKGCIDTFVYDEGVPDLGRMAYTPQTAYLNAIIKNWYNEGIEFCGILHTHPNGQRGLSGADVQYINYIMDVMPNFVKKLYFPLVFPGACMIGYCAKKKKEKIIIATDDIIIIKE